MAMEVKIHKKLGEYELDVHWKSTKKRIGILGASGSGKSLTLKSIAGIDRRPDPQFSIVLLPGRGWSLLRWAGVQSFPRMLWPWLRFQPDLISFIAFVTSIVTVPDLGFGIKPFGPNTLPNLPTTPIISGVATTTS